MNIGRPRSNCPQDDELDELGKELVAWAKSDNDPAPLRFCEWYSPKHILRHTWEKMLEKEAFRVHYEEAQQYLGRRYIDGTVNPSIAHRLLRCYVPEVKADEEAKARFEAELSAEKTDKAVDAQAASQMSSMLGMLKGLQDAATASRSIPKSDI